MSRKHPVFKSTKTFTLESVMNNRFRKSTMNKLLDLPPHWLDKFVDFIAIHPEVFDEITDIIENCACKPRIKKLWKDKKGVLMDDSAPILNIPHLHMADCHKVGYHLKYPTVSA